MDLRLNKSKNIELNNLQLHCKIQINLGQLLFLIRKGKQIQQKKPPQFFCHS